MITSAPPPLPSASVVLDLRRRRDAEFAEVLVRRAEWLPPEERAIIEAVFRDGVTAEQLSRLRNCTPRAMRRRIRGIVNRALSPRFAFVIRRRDEWSPTRRRIATFCALHGHSRRDTATRLGVSVHLVRRHMDAISALEESASS